MPMCKAVVCEALSQPVRGSLNCTHPIGLFHYSLNCSCEEGLLLDGAESVQCTASGNWTAPMPVCKAVVCEDLSIPPGGSLNCTHPIGDFQYSSTCHFHCGGEILSDEVKSVQCTAFGNWTGPTLVCAGQGRHDRQDHWPIIVALGIAAFIASAVLILWLRKCHQKAKKPSPNCEQGLEDPCLQ
ncbi:L-selectin-like [Latimeria chalumnae]|uniref:L-selectin-like n=1 Tax=Latimeria chalumnae TaxID=7897 RepID=UPI0006D90ECA|nr:PREDICTED: L-selectin-like [Latimeria chalumnae]|eukprot:XP_014342747.1 PREDICTED: L-selectin-like [Latimeria chalumnae]